MRFTSRWNWNLEMLVFMEGGKPENPEKNPRSKERAIYKLHPHMTPGKGVEPGPHWWEASALTTAPSLLPHVSSLGASPSSRCLLNSCNKTYDKLHQNGVQLTAACFMNRSVDFASVNLPLT